MRTLQIMTTVRPVQLDPVMSTRSIELNVGWIFNELQVTSNSNEVQASVRTDSPIKLK